VVRFIKLEGIFLTFLWRKIGIKLDKYCFFSRQLKAFTHPMLNCVGSMHPNLSQVSLSSFDGRDGIGPEENATPTLVDGSASSPHGSTSPLRPPGTQYTQDDECNGEFVTERLLDAGKLQQGAIVDAQLETDEALGAPVVNEPLPLEDGHAALVGLRSGNDGNGPFKY
jgi:hypothetical protein